MTEPVATYGNLRYWDNFGEYGFCTKLRVEGLRNLGGVLSPFNAFLLLHGMETLPLRMDAHVANAQAVAEWLAADDRVSWVRYAGLPDDPGHDAGRALHAEGPGRGVLVRRARRARGRRGVHRGASSCARTSRTSATRARSSSTRPRRRTASSPRTRCRPRACCPELVRLSVGIEDLDDILFDLDRGLAAASRCLTPGSRRAPRCAGGSCATRGRSPSSAPRRTPRARATSSLTYLASSSADYEIWPVTPREGEILGMQTYPSLADLPGAPDIVDVFRREPSCPASPGGRRSGRGDVLDAARAAQRRGRRRSRHDAGLEVVSNRCVKIEHARFAGGLHLAGFDTGVISSRRSRG